MATFKCPDCGRKVSTSATMCPKCGRIVTDADRAKRQQPGAAQKRILKFIGYIALIVVGLGFYKGATQTPEEKARVEAANAALKQRRQAEREAEERRRVAETPRVTAVQLAHGYYVDESYADKLCYGKDLIVAGLVADISKSVTGSIRLTLKEPEKIPGVIAYLKRNEADSAVSLQKSDAVSLLCTVKGMDGRNVKLDQCSLLH